MKPVERVHLLQERIAEGPFDAVWVHPGQDFRYLTGLAPISLERLFGFVVPPRGAARLVVPLLSAEECSAIEKCELFTWTDDEGPAAAVGGSLEGIASLGVSASMPLWALKSIRDAVPGIEAAIEDSYVAALREGKDEGEIDALRTASKATDGVVDWVGTLDLYDLTELELASQIMQRFLQLGMEPGPEPIVSTGANAAMPHYTGGQVRISAADPLLLDIGGRVDGYWSDITRVYFPEPLDDDIRRAYDAVVEAHVAACEAAGPGVPCQEVDRAARAVIERAGLGDGFIHRTGHGLGLEVHEPPYLRAGNRSPLEAGHVVTIEPGVYEVGRFGVRYENVVVVTEDGVDSLNESPHLHRLP